MLTSPQRIIAFNKAARSTADHPRPSRQRVQEPLSRM